MKKIIPIISIIFFIACQNNQKDISLDTIISHYNNIKLPKSFALQHEEEHFIPYQSYDYKNPNGLIASYTTEIDSDKKYLYNKSITNVGGGFTFEYITTIKDTAAFEYSLNKIWKGNVIDSLNAKEDYDYYQRFSLSQLNVYKAKAFLKNAMDSLKFSFNKIADEAVITKKDEKDTISYIFSVDPIRLKKIIENNQVRVFEKFEDYKDFSYASKSHFYTDNIIKKNVVISSFNEINSITSSKLDLPKGFTFEKAKLNKEKVAKIGKNTYIIRNLKFNRNILFTDINNNITVIGAPSSDKLSESVLDIIKDKRPNSKVKFVYVTHLHSDHIMGLGAYAKRNITIIADQHTINGIKDFESFKDIADTFKFKLIKDRETLNGIQFHYPENRHCKSQGFAYCISDNIIYQGDFMQISPKLIIPTIMPETTKSFIERIYKDNLSVKTIISQHQVGAEIPMDFLNAYYKKFD